MKKLFLSFAVIAGMSMISCGNKEAATEEAPVEEATEVVEEAVEAPADTTVVAEGEATEAPAEAAEAPAAE